MVDEIVDFVSDRKINTDERCHYENKYGRINKSANQNWFICEEVKKKWYNQDFPSGRDILEKMENIKDKKLLLLGNGLSIKEIYFAFMGGTVIFSDISVNAIIRSKKVLAQCIYENNLDVQFYAIDALKLPFDDMAFDYVYAFGMVHHLSDKLPFLKECHRVLKPRGKCIFFDDAYSPLWYRIKTGFLKQIMAFHHRRNKISPADLVATYEGGFKEEQIKRWSCDAGFKDYFMIKREFLSYLYRSGLRKLFHLSNKNSKIIQIGDHFFSQLDSKLLKSISWYQNNLIHMVWGFSR